jgi:DNA-binding HxlR family transcriptional regulator
MYDPVRAVLGSKWSLELLDLLAERGPLNFSDIEETLGASPDMVTKRLRLLERHGLVNRTEQSARDVRYAITASGRSVLDRATEIATYLDEDHPSADP